MIFLDDEKLPPKGQIDELIDQKGKKERKIGKCVFHINCFTFFF
jgi:hypothetical protein